MTQRRSPDAQRISSKASLGQRRSHDKIRGSRTSSPQSVIPRILAAGHCSRARTSTLISSGRVWLAGAFNDNAMNNTIYDLDLCVNCCYSVDCRAGVL